MKGEIAICASPSCNKQFVKKSYRQNCCGSSTCRTLYNRHKNGQPLYPTFIANTGFTGKQTAPLPTTTSIPTSVKRGNFMNNVTTSVLSGAVGPTIASAIGATTFTQRAATAAFSGAVMPLLKEFISSGNQIRFSSLDEEMIKLEADKNYWQKQKDKAVNGIMPYKSLGGGVLGGILGYLMTERKSKPANYYQLSLKKQNKIDREISDQQSRAQRNALIGGALLGGIGGYLDHSESQNLAVNSQNVIDNADKEMFLIDQRLNQLREEKARIKQWVNDEILVENEQGVYTVNNQILKDIISADEYRSIKIPTIEFKGAYKYLLSEAREKFYKIVSGLPEQGKTSYCVKFATYYAANHGRVLYMPSEQSGKNLDFQKVIGLMDGKGFDIDINVNAYDFQKLLERVQGYDLVILDSINNMKLSATEVKEINKRAAIMAVMQSTK
ncbi:MAG: hypothetical protein AB8G86_26040, partial [Saprospiraceae bacterium]